MALASQPATFTGLRAAAEVVGWGDDSSGQATPWSNLGEVVAIAAGWHHSLALKPDGSVVGWGNDDFRQASGSHTIGQIGIAAGNSYSLSYSGGPFVNGWGEGYNGYVDLPGEPSPVVAVAAGGSHALTLRADGSVASVGGLTNVPAGLSNVIAIAAGTDHSLAVRADGTVAGWGRPWPDYGQASPPVGLSNVVAVSAGSGTSLALRADGTVVGWGDVSFVPPGLKDVIAIATGGGHHLALTANGTVAAWGRDSHGQTAVPVGLSNVVAIAAGGNFSLALRGLPPGQAKPVPVAPRILVATADRPFLHRILLKHGAISYGVVGLPAGVTLDTRNGILTGRASTGGTFNLEFSATNSQGSCTWTVPLYVNIPLPFAVITNFAAATIGNHFDLPVVTQNTETLLASGLPPGLNFDPILNQIGGVPTTCGDYAVSLLVSNRFGISTANVVIRVSPLAAWGDSSSRQTEVPGSLSNLVALTAGGHHNLGLRSVGTTIGWRVPSSPGTLSNAVRIAAGFDHNLALRNDGSVVAWGSNTYRQTNVPSGLGNVVDVAAGSYHSLALRADGTVVSWGRNQAGQTNVPSSLTRVVAIAGGSAHSLALRSDGTVVAWGLNSHGQTQVPAGLVEVIALAAGGNHSLALQADGSVVSWGSNASGQTRVPPGLSNVVALAAGGSHSLALLAQGRMCAWGDDGYGQVAYANRLSNVVAIAAGERHSLALCTTDLALDQAHLRLQVAAPDQLDLQLLDTGAGTYTIQMSSSLEPRGTWKTLWSGMPGNDAVTLGMEHLTAPCRFFRLMRP